MTIENKKNPSDKIFNCIPTMTFASMCKVDDIINVKKYYFENEIDLSYDDNLIFRNACKRSDCDILKFLILEVNLKKTKAVDDLLKLPLYKKAKDIFDLKQLNQKLKDELFIIEHIVDNKRKI